MKISPIINNSTSIYKNIKNRISFKSDITNHQTPTNSFEYSQKQKDNNNINLNDLYLFLKEYCGMSKFDKSSFALTEKFVNYVQQGKLSYNILRGWDDSYYDVRFKHDAELYFYGIKNGMNEEQIKNLFVPAYNSINKGMSNTNEGDLFEVNKTVYLKMNEKQKYKLKISRDTYLNLFPPINYYSQSSKTGDCYLLSAISSMWDSPFYKAYILDCFSETKDGKLLVKFRHGKNYILTDLKGNLPKDKAKNQEYYVKGSNGIKLLEALYEDKLCSDKNDQIINHILMQVIEKLSNDDSKTDTDTEEKQNKIIKSVCNGGDNKNTKYVLSNINYHIEPELEFKTYEEGKQNTYYIYNLENLQKKHEKSQTICTKNPALFYRGEKGNIIDTFRIFGLSGYIDDKYGEIRHKLILTPKILDFISENNNGFYLYGVSVKNINNTPEDEPVNKEKGLIAGHAYSLKIEQNKETKKYEYILTNPYNSSKKVKLNRDEMLHYVYSVGIAHQRLQ